MTDYEQYLAELQEQKEEQIKLLCNKLDQHTWAHYYDFMQCSRCGKIESIPTSREYLEQ